MKKMILLAASAALLSAPAFAADAVVYSPAPVAMAAPAFDWSGAYIGVNLGYGWGDISATNSSVATTGRLFGQPAGTFSPGIFPGVNGSDRVNGLVGGAQIGYNRQIDNLVFGVEADYQAANLKTSGSFGTGPSFETSSQLQSFGTLRGRLGFAADNVMLYGTGGLAIGQAKASLSVQGGALDPVYRASASETMVGYAIGAGAEWAIAHSKWSMKAEYLYTDFGSKTFDFDFGSGDSATSRGKVTANVVRVGLNYRF